MEAIIAIAACVLLAIQAHRNYLIIKESKRQDQAAVTVIEHHAPDVTLSIDYNKLSNAIESAILNSSVKIHNAKEGV